MGIRYQITPIRGGWRGKYIIVNEKDGNLALMITHRSAGRCPAVFNSPDDVALFLSMLPDKDAGNGGIAVHIDPKRGVPAKAAAEDFMPDDVVYLVKIIH